MQTVTTLSDTHVPALTGLPVVGGYELVGDGTEAVALTSQSDPEENLVYLVPLGGGDWEPHPDFSYEPLVTEFRVLMGTHEFERWYLANKAAPTVGVDALYWYKDSHGQAVEGVGGIQRSGGSLSLDEQPALAGGAILYPGEVLDLSSRGYATDVERTRLTRTLIDGFDVTRGGFGEALLGPGAAWSEGLEKLLEFADIAPYAGGAAGDFVYFYVYEFGGATAIWPHTDLPDTPYEGTARSMSGDGTKRYVAEARQDGSGLLYRHKSTSIGNTRLVHYLEDTAASPFRVVSGGTATGEQTLGLGEVAGTDAVAHKLVPVTADWVLLDVEANASAGVSLGNADDGITLSSTVAVRHVKAGAHKEVWMPLASDQTISWLNKAGSGATNISVLGYRALR